VNYAVRSYILFVHHLILLDVIIRNDDTERKLEHSQGK
jgi:hypothetical protein